MTHIAVYVAVPIGFLIGAVLILALGPYKAGSVAAVTTPDHPSPEEVPGAQMAEQADNRAVSAVGEKHGGGDLRRRIVDSLGGEEKTRQIVADARAEAQRMERDGEVPDTTHVGQRVRAGLDVCFLLAILAAALLVMVYEYKIDPVVMLASLFPTEAGVLGQALSRFKADWMRT